MAVHVFSRNCGLDSCNELKLFEAGCGIVFRQMFELYSDKCSKALFCQFELLGAYFDEFLTRFMVHEGSHSINRAKTLFTFINSVEVS